MGIHLKLQNTTAPVLFTICKYVLWKKKSDHLYPIMKCNVISYKSDIRWDMFNFQIAHFETLIVLQSKGSYSSLPPLVRKRPCTLNIISELPFESTLASYRTSCLGWDGWSRIGIFSVWLGNFCKRLLEELYSWWVVKCVILGPVWRCSKL